MACNKFKVIEKLRKSGEFTKEDLEYLESNFSTVIDFLDINENVEIKVPKGKVFAHITNSSNSKILGIGSFVGTSKAVEDYAKQMSDEKEKTLYTVETTKELKAIRIVDQYNDGWTTDTILEKLKDIYPKVEWSTDFNEQLVGLGYDAVVYADISEGTKRDSVDSFTLINPKAVKIIKKSSSMVDQTDIQLELLESDVVYGSKSGVKKQDWKKLKEFRRRIGRDVSKMKELLEELYTLDGKKETDQHMDHLRGLFDLLEKSHFKDLQTYVINTSNESWGTLQGKKLAIAVSGRPKSAENEMGAAEIYAHETTHAIIQYAISREKADSKVHVLMQEVRFLMKQVQEQLGSGRKEPWKVLLPETSINPEREAEIAKELYKYIFEGKNTEAEFLAHAITNPEFMKRISVLKVKSRPEPKTILERLVEAFSTLVDIVMGNYKFVERNKTAYDQALGLTMALAKVNNDSINRAEDRLNIFERAAELVEEGNEVIGGMIDQVVKYVKKNDEKALEERPKDGSVLQNIVWTGKFLLKVMRNEVYRNYFGHMLSAYWISPEGPIRDWARAFSESSEMQKAVEWLGAASDNIDRMRTTVIDETKADILGKFTNRPNEEEQTDITEVLLETDLQSIMGDYVEGRSVAKLRKLLTNDEYLNRELKKAKEYLVDLDKKHKNWNLNQAHGLGVFMVKGRGNKGQNINALSIARGIMSSERKYLKNERYVVAMIDKVATLTALKYIKKSAKSNVARLLREETNGVLNILQTHKGYVKTSKKINFKNGAETLMVKGYTKEIFDEKLSVEIAPVSKQKEMEMLGFTMVQVLEKDPNDKSESMGMFTSEAFITNEWHNASTRLTRLHTKGTTLTDVYFKEGSKLAQEKIELTKIKMDKDRLDIVKAMEKGEWIDDGKGINVLPVVDQYGNVTDYRYVLPKDAKKHYLKQNKKVGDVLARSFGSIYDKEGSEEHNKKVLKIILDYMDEDWIPGTTSGKKGMEYVLIGPKSTNSDAKEIYKVLPPVFKDAIEKREDKTLAVPRELMHLYFGYRHLSIVDFPGLKYITPKVVRNLIKIVETMWIEAIKVLKGNILMKMPFVLVGNLVSNVVFAIQTGEVNPVTLMKDYLQSFRDIRNFIKNDRELAKLRVKSHANTISSVERTRMKILENEQNHNPAKELFDIGMYQAIQEDVEVNTSSSRNRWKQIADDKLANVPSVVRTPLQWMYLSSETKWFKVNQEVLQMSDLMARDVENRRRKRIEQKYLNGNRTLPKWWTDKHGSEKLTAETKILFKKEAEKIRHYELLENYVNYNKPASKLEEYLNRVGAIMFTKYTKNIQKIIAKSAWKHPINALTILLGQAYLVDVETIQDQALFTRSWYNFGYGPGDVLPFHNPVDQFMDIITPALVKSETFRFTP